jgi:uncharacterized membrane protein YoaK (UPF0700 family)
VTSSNIEKWKKLWNRIFTVISGFISGFMFGIIVSMIYIGYALRSPIPLDIVLYILILSIAGVASFIWGIHLALSINKK